MGNPKCTFSCLTSLTTNCCVEWSRIEILHPVWESVVCENPRFLECDAASLCKQFLTFWRHYSHSSGPDSLVSVATGYGLDGPGIESRWGRDFPQLSRSALGAHPASCTMSTRSFRGVKSSRGVTLTPHPLLVQWSWKSTAIPLLPFWACTACTEPQCLYKGALYLYFTVFQDVRDCSPHDTVSYQSLITCDAVSHPGRLERAATQLWGHRSSWRVFVSDNKKVVCICIGRLKLGTWSVHVAFCCVCPLFKREDAYLSTLE